MKTNMKRVFSLFAITTAVTINLSNSAKAETIRSTSSELIVQYQNPFPILA